MSQKKLSLRMLILINTLFVVTHWKCSRKDKSVNDNTESSQYVPDTWNGEEDWSHSSLKFQDLQ